MTHISDMWSQRTCHSSINVFYGNKRCQEYEKWFCAIYLSYLARLEKR